MTGTQARGRSSAPLTELCRQLDQRIEEIAGRLLGEPNRALSTRNQLRFGRNGSLAVEIAGERCGRWYDHEQKQGGGALDLVVRCTGLARREAAEQAATELGIAVERRSPSPRRRIVASYDYRDETGAVLFQVVRYAPKTFRQRCPDGRGGWSWRVRGIRQVPYRLPELLGAALEVPVFVVEGEKDADRLAGLGLVATCNAGGANSWPEALTPAFRGRTVYVVPDNDAAGRSHAQKVAAALEGVADSIRIVTLPDLQPGGDVSDWLDDGGDAPELLQLCQAAPAWKRDGGDLQPEYPVLLPYCEEAITLAFSERHADDLRYCDFFGRWSEWRAGRWREDAKRRVFTLARRLCRDHCASALHGIDDERAAARIGTGIASAKTVAAVVNLARADPRHATAPEEWDVDPWALNTPKGIIDLRTGKMGRHDRSALLSKITAVAAADSQCPRWRRFLDEVTGGDVDLQAFLARVAGYGLTGSTREHALFFLYGTGANGKGTFLNTLTGVLGDYAQVASMDTFTESQTDRHPAELAVLRGARVVAAQETDEGRRWAESRIKALTGGDPITARFMRQDFFTYTPQFKLMIAGNHKPGLRNIDEAIRRRFHLLPFTVRIPPEQRDLQLFEALRQEWPAILGWAVRGCLQWQAEGLNPPSAVIEATSEYFDDEDVFGQWVGEHCIRDLMAHETTRDLYAAWSAWVQRRGMSAGTEPRFRGALKARGFVPKREAGTGRGGFAGIRLLRKDYTDDPRYGG